MDTADLKNNVLDKATSSAHKAVDATRSAADSAIDAVSDRVDRATAPFDAAVAYTRTNPATALLIAAMAGAILSSLLRLSRR